jgi:hypothetical protein
VGVIGSRPLKKTAARTTASQSLRMTNLARCPSSPAHAHVHASTVPEAIDCLRACVHSTSPRRCAHPWPSTAACCGVRVTICTLQVLRSSTLWISTAMLDTDGLGFSLRDALSKWAAATRVLLETDRTAIEECPSFREPPPCRMNFLRIRR